MFVLCKNFGCRLNYAELSSISFQLQKKGYIILGQNNFDKLIPQIIIANTCSLTKTAHQKVLITLHKYQNQYPLTKIIVLGCATRNNLTDFKNFQVLDKKDCVYWIDKNFPLQKKLSQVWEKKEVSSKFLASNRSNNPFFRTRAFVKIQDGCQNFCSYCVIPYLRGEEKSLSLEEIIKYLQKLAEKWFTEIVLSGIQIMKWGKDLGNWQNLTFLLQKILHTTNFSRIRLSSLQPNLIDHDFLDIIQNPRIGQHFHLSLQTGVNHLLQKMNRCYTVEQFEEIIQKIREKLPLASITTDVIVGFPGETEVDFQKTYQFCQKINFAKIHVFPFSKRKKTSAYCFPNQISTSQKQKRSQQLRKLSASLEKNFAEKNQSVKQEILIEKNNSDGSYGYSSNYVYFYLPKIYPIGEIIKTSP